MQTPKPIDGRWLSWMHRDMPNGVFRVKKAKWLNEEPATTGWDNWTGAKQADAEIALALEITGESMSGYWMCWGLKVGELTRVIAFRVA